MANGTVVLTDGFSHDAPFYCPTWNDNTEAVCLPRTADIATDPIEQQNGIRFTHFASVKYVLTPDDGSPTPTSGNGQEPQPTPPSQGPQSGATTANTIASGGGAGGGVSKFLYFFIIFLFFLLWFVLKPKYFVSADQQCTTSITNTNDNNVLITRRRFEQRRRRQQHHSNHCGRARHRVLSVDMWWHRRCSSDCVTQIIIIIIIIIIKHCYATIIGCKRWLFNAWRTTNIMYVLFLLLILCWFIFLCFVLDGGVVERSNYGKLFFLFLSKFYFYSKPFQFYF